MGVAPEEMDDVGEVPTGGMEKTWEGMNSETPPENTMEKPPALVSSQVIAP